VPLRLIINGCTSYKISALDRDYRGCTYFYALKRKQFKNQRLFKKDKAKQLFLRSVNMFYVIVIRLVLLSFNVLM